MHEGHRSRLTGKLIGGGKLYEHEILEVLLFNACPRRDLNAAAHSLIERFGSIDGVLSASADNLAAVVGVGENMAEYIACLGKALSLSSGCASFAVIKNRKQFVGFISKRAKQSCDVLEICVLDKDGRIKRICCFTAESGRRAGISDSELLRAVSVYRPYGLFVANRRSYGASLPEECDDALVGAIDRVAKLCGSYFYDYCITGADGSVYSYYVEDRLVFGGCKNGGSYG